VLEAGWGLFFMLAGAGFVLVAARPRAAAAGVAQLTIVTSSLGISAVASGEPILLAFVAALALQTAIVSRLFSRARPEASAREPGLRVARPLLALAVAGVVPWVAYALRMWAWDRENRPYGDNTLGVDHYSVQGALALACALLPLVAALRRDLRPYVPTFTAIVAFYVGLVSFSWPDAAGGLGRGWSVAAMAWGIGLLAAIWVRRSRALLPQT
jgi:hypothetical protein